MLSIKEAGNGTYTEINGKLFNPDEIKRATAIANELDGLTIEEAHRLLEKMKTYLMQSVFRI